MNRSLSQLVGSFIAYQTAVHSLIATHPDRGALANDFMGRMDHFGSMRAADGLPIAESWQLILQEMTKPAEKQGA